MLSIYAPYVTETAVSYEYEVPSLEEFQRRFDDFTQHYPWLVAEDEDGHIIGYAYAHPFIPRAAYQYSVETTIYLRRDERRRGAGRQLYTTLEERLRGQGVLNMYACVGYVEQEDEYLTHDSIHFHEHMGFHSVGLFRACGRKFNRWYDMVWMEKLIGEHT